MSVSEVQLEDSRRLFPMLKRRVFARRMIVSKMSPELS